MVIYTWDGKYLNFDKQIDSIFPPFLQKCVIFKYAIYKTNIYLTTY